MRISVLPKASFDAVMKNNGITDENVESFGAFFISITDTEGDFSDHYFSSNHKNVLNLTFDDVTSEEGKSPTNKGKITIFTENHASQILDFLERNKNKNGAVLHCAAGISRSGAIGEFIARYFDSLDQFIIENSHVMPNSYIIRILMNEWNKRIDNV